MCTLSLAIEAREDGPARLVPLLIFSVSRQGGKPMSQSHLRQLHAALTRRGWTVIERMRGDVDVRGPATWEVRSGEAGLALLIEFAGFGGRGEDIPLIGFRPRISLLTRRQDGAIR
jgi:hypothetical protein